MFPRLCLLYTLSFLFVSGSQMDLSPTKRMDFSRYENTRTDVLEASKPYHCTSCPARFFSIREVKIHMSESHGAQMPYCCHLCGKGYLSYRGLKHHMSVHEGKQFHCPICDKKSNQRGNMLQHLRKVHKSDQCSKCMQVFPIENFQLHVSTCYQMNSIAHS